MEEVPIQELAIGDLVRTRDAACEIFGRIEYFHVELAEHDVIVAEGAESESFVDYDSRWMFHNASEYGALYPDAVSAPAA